jgi:hypothetical protein
MNKEQEALKFKLDQIWNELNDNLPEINFNDDNENDNESNDIEPVRRSFFFV